MTTKQQKINNLISCFSQGDFVPLKYSVTDFNKAEWIREKLCSRLNKGKSLEQCLQDHYQCYEDQGYQVISYKLIERRFYTEIEFTVIKVVYNERKIFKTRSQAEWYVKQHLGYLWQGWVNPAIPELEF